MKYFKSVRNINNHPKQRLRYPTCSKYYRACIALIFWQQVVTELIGRFPCCSRVMIYGNWKFYGVQRSVGLSANDGFTELLFLAGHLLTCRVLHWSVESNIWMSANVRAKNCPFVSMLTFLNLDTHGYVPLMKITTLY